MSTVTAIKPGAAAPRYGILRTVELGYEQAIARVTETLKAQGFGILTEIDVKATLKKKLDKDFTPYVILGACNPPLAHRALSAEIDIGLLLPCNVNVYVDPDSGKTVVSAIDPQVLVEVTGRKDLQPIAEEVRAKLTAAIAAV
jgi:uncharacterized protein (DUF302 family)